MGSDREPMNNEQSAMSNEGGPVAAFANWYAGGHRVDCYLEKPVSRCFFPHHPVIIIPRPDACPEFHFQRDKMDICFGCLAKDPVMVNGLYQALCPFQKLAQGKGEENED